MAMKNDSLAIIDLRKALQLDTTQIDIYGEIAKSLYASGKFVDAAEAYHAYGQKSGKATLNDHFKEGFSYYQAYKADYRKSLTDKTF